MRGADSTAEKVRPMPIARDSSEFLVNTSTANSQSQSSVAVLDDGRILVAWTDSGSGAIRGRIVNADGSSAVPEFPANTDTAGAQSEGVVAALPDGRFILAWKDDSQTGGDTSSSAIRARIFDADGTPSAPAFLANVTAASLQLTPSLTVLADGRILMAWTDFSQSAGDTSSTAVRARIFHDDGSEAVPEFLVNATTPGSQGSSAVAALADGGFVACWSDDSQTTGDTSFFAVRARVFDAFGNQTVAEFVVNTATAGHQFDPAVTALADGRFAVCWTDYSATGGDTDGSAIRARIFNADGTESVPEFLVNASAASLQVDARIAQLADGRLAVVWIDNSQSGEDTDSFSVRARIFNPDGTEAVPEFVVNTTTASFQLECRIAVLRDGRFVVSWSDNSQTGGDTSGYAVRAQVFDPTRFIGTDAAEAATGGSLRDRLAGKDGNDTLRGGDGGDRLDGDRGRDVLDGGSGNDVLDGGTKGDRLAGRAGRDVLDGGSGNDVLEGGADADTLEGGDGSDDFVFGAGHGRDVIADFQPGADRLDFSGHGGVRGLGALDIRVVGGDTVIDTGGGDRIILTGFAGTLTLADFLF
jgi:hypothetical protein